MSVIRGRSFAVVVPAVLVVVVVSSGLSVGVEVGGWEELGESVDGVDLDGPFGVVDQTVMKTTNQNSIVQCGRPAVCPVANVMPGAPFRWSVTVWEGASSVPEDQGAADGSGEQSAG